MDLQASRLRPWLWATFAGLVVALIVYTALLLLVPASDDWLWLGGWAICGVELVASSLCIARGLVAQRGRGAAVVLGLSLLSWTVGDIVLTIESLGGAIPSTPSPADAFYLAFYPLAYTGVLLFMRGKVGRLAPSQWLDGAIAGLGAAAVCAAFAFHDIVSSTGTGELGTLTNLAYPVGDVLLLGLVVGGFAVLSGRRRTSWALLAAGMALNAVGDTSNLFPNSFGATRFGIVFDAIAWPAAIVMMAMAVWLRQRPTDLLRPARPARSLLPNLAAAGALVIVFTDSFHSVGHVAMGLATATLTMVGIRLALSMREIRALSEERHRQAVTDDLTGLANRRYLFRVLHAFFDECRDTGIERSLAFLFVDLDHFKEINDSFGHPVGDQLLRQLGDRLSESLRENDLLVRLGGDEFAVVLIDGDTAYATSVAERLTASLAQPFALDAVSALVSASIGIALAPTDAHDSEELVRCADVAMYRAKLGHIPFAHFEPQLDEDGGQVRMLEELRAAIDQRRLVLHYQSQVDLRSGEVVGFEALVRWGHHRLGLVPPDRFLPLAEEAGLMGEITEWVLGEATAQCAAWRADDHPVTVAVNVSPGDLLRPEFVDTVRRHLGAQRLPAGALVLEITETGVIDQFGTASLVIDELRRLGVMVSIDDFGAGVTSLAYLGRLSVGELKLDRSFITGIVGEDDERVRHLVGSTVDLGHAMGLRIVAEGIEDAGTLSALTELGCDVAQGYFLATPKPPEALRFESAAGRVPAGTSG